MSDFPFDAVGFDLDGTLLDTHRDLGAAVNFALAEGGFDPVPVNSSKDLIGGGAKVMLARAVDAQGGMDPDAFRALYKKMLAFYADNNAVHTAPYPGIETVLDALESRGVKMAVVTNKFEDFARAILNQLGLAHRFVTIIGGDTMGKGRAKPQPDPIVEARARCEGGAFAYIGDSSYDMKAARAADVPFVLAAYGYCDLQEEDMQADAVAYDPAQLTGALESLG
jgi:phosphoglycolate phosphatase